MARKSKAKTPKADLAEQIAAQETESVLSDEAVPTVSEPEKAAEEAPPAVEAAAPAEESEKPVASRRRTAKSKPVAEKPKRAKGAARRKKNADAAQAEDPKTETPETVYEQAAEPKAEEMPAEKPATAKKPGRKPMSEAEKAANAKLREEEKKKAAAMVPTLTLQYGGRDVDLKALERAARDDFKASHKRTLLTELNLYLKPEENTLYYVANGSVEGKIVF